VHYFKIFLNQPVSTGFVYNSCCELILAHYLKDILSDYRMMCECMTNTHLDLLPIFSFSCKTQVMGV